MIDQTEIVALLNKMQEVSLAEITCVNLMERRDTKYVFNTTLLPSILSELKSFYKVLTIENRKLHPYSTYYYDTDDLLMYNQHQNGKLNRYKLRFRRYDDFNTTYVELKFKSNKEETIKKRVQIPNRKEMTTQALELVETETSLEFSKFHETLTNRFTRITLVDKDFTERLTIDINLSFQKGMKNADYPSIVVAELKQGNLSMASKFTETMKNIGIRQLGVSKYCIGMMLLTPGIKYNNFKSKILQIQKVSL